MSILSRLFGIKSPDVVSQSGLAEEHKGFAITPTPIKEGGQYRVSARIEKDGRVHALIRADTMTGLDEATAASVAKARQVIDERGEALFG